MPQRFSSLGPLQVRRPLIENWKDADFGRPLTYLGHQYPVDRRYVDVLAEDRATGALVALELKQDPAPTSTVTDQLDDYVRRETVARLRGSKPVWGRLVAEAIPEPVRRLADNRLRSN